MPFLIKYCCFKDNKNLYDSLIDQIVKRPVKVEELLTVDTRFTPSGNVLNERKPMNLRCS